VGRTQRGCIRPVHKNLKAQKAGENKKKALSNKKKALTNHGGICGAEEIKVSMLFFCGFFRVSITNSNLNISMVGDR
jgi:hypothetical protein